MKMMKLSVKNREISFIKKGCFIEKIHVWFVTPDGEIIFQRRAKDKDTYPDLLDATVGGHVEPGNHILMPRSKRLRKKRGSNLTRQISMN